MTCPDNSGSFKSHWNEKALNGPIFPQTNFQIQEPILILLLSKHISTNFHPSLFQQILPVTKNFWFYLKYNQPEPQPNFKIKFKRYTSCTSRLTRTSYRVRNRYFKQPKTDIDTDFLSKLIRSIFFFIFLSFLFNSSQIISSIPFKRRHPLEFCHQPE